MVCGRDGNLSFGDLWGDKLIMGNSLPMEAVGAYSQTKRRVSKDTNIGMRKFVSGRAQGVLSGHVTCGIWMMGHTPGIRDAYTTA